MLYLAAHAGNVGNALLQFEAGSNASSVREWDSMPSNEAYVGLGGQFRYASSGPLHWRSC